MTVERLNTDNTAGVVAQASAWFIEFRAGDVDGPLRGQFIDWLRRSPDHIQAYLDISRMWAELPASDTEGRWDIASLVEQARHSADVVRLSPGDVPYVNDLSRSRSRSRSRAFDRRLRGRVALACASLAGIAVAGIALWKASVAPEAYSTGIGEQRSVQLADGSTVELNAQSTLQVRFSEHQRDVALVRGQALFKVAKDKQRPFLVSAGSAQVRAVGTEFDVYRKQDSTVVTVIEGRIEAQENSEPLGSPAVVLSAGEQLTLVPHSVMKPTHTDTAVATAWTQKHLVFEGTPLSDVAEQFNRYTLRPLIIEDRDLRQMRISGVYSSTDPASLINFLRDQPGLLVIETDHQVRIVRRGASI